MSRSGTRSLRLIGSINSSISLASNCGESITKTAVIGLAGLQFNLHAIIGGCLPADPSPQLFYIYPEGNWLEASPDSPYFIIGRTYYGKFVLDRLLNFESSLNSALALALLAFDATRTSVTDVDYPIDVAVLPMGTRRPVFRRYEMSDLQVTTAWWSQV